jgi:hypothetical protein
MFRRRVRQVGEISAGAEGPAGARDDDNARRLVVSRSAHGVVELAQDGIGHGVALLGAIDRDQRDPVVVDLVADVRVSHRS